MLDFAGHCARAINTGTVIYLEGELGAGKTTFARGFLQGLGYTGKVKSPTYTLIEPYEIANKDIFHLDLYRLTEPEAFLYLGWNDLFSSEAIALIEWPEKAATYLPPADLIITLLWVDEHQRKLTIEATNHDGTKLIEALRLTS